MNAKDAQPVRPVDRRKTDRRQDAPPTRTFRLSTPEAQAQRNLDAVLTLTGHWRRHAAARRQVTRQRQRVADYILTEGNQ